MAKKPKKPKPTASPTDAEFAASIQESVTTAFTSPILQEAVRKGVEDGILTFFERTFTRRVVR